MPFALIFSAMLCIVLAFVFLAGLPGSGSGPRFVEILIGAQLPLIAVGLMMGQRWARWIGLAAGLLLTCVGFVLTNSRGSMVDVLVLLSGALLALLLAVPATGTVRRTLPDGEAQPAVPGLILGAVAVLLLVGAAGMFTLSVIGRPAPPPRRPAPGEPGLSQVTWNDFATGLEKAEAESKLMLVDFYAVWCGPCKHMDQVTFRDPSVVAGLQDVIPVRIDAEGSDPVRGFKGEELAARYQVASYPTLALIDSREKLITRLRGATGPERLLSWLEGALARHAVNPGAEEERPDGLVM